MNVLRKWTAAIAVACMLVLPGWAGEIPRAKPEAVGMSSERLAKVTSKVQKMVDDLIPQVSVLLARDTLFYQAEGGRIFEAQTWAEAESATSFRSITEADASTGGGLKPVARAKTVAQIMDKIVEITRERAGGNRLVGIIGHARVPERAEKLKRMLLSQVQFDELIVSEVSASVVVHGGIGIIDYSFCPRA